MSEKIDPYIATKKDACIVLHDGYVLAVRNKQRLGEVEKIPHIKQKAMYYLLCAKCLPDFCNAQGDVIIDEALLQIMTSVCQMTDWVDVLEIEILHQILLTYFEMVRERMLVTELEQR